MIPETHAASKGVLEVSIMSFDKQMALLGIRNLDLFVDHGESF